MDEKCLKTSTYFYLYHLSIVSLCGYIVRAAKDYGYQITLISDGCATKDLEWNGVTLPATLIQNVYMASLNKKFANVILSSEIV